MQKIALYKEAANPVIELIVKAQHELLTLTDLQAFDKDRLSTTALLAMSAPNVVFNEYNNMIDYIYDAVEEKQKWSFDVFRGKALIFLSEIRRDIGLYDDTLSYNALDKSIKKIKRNPYDVVSFFTNHIDRVTLHPTQTQFKTFSTDAVRKLTTSYKKIRPSTYPVINLNKLLP